MIRENIVLATFAPRHMASLRLPSTRARLLSLVRCGASRCSDESVAAARDPRPQPLLLCGDRRRRRSPPRHFPPFFPSPPDSCITTWRSDSVVALLSNPVATAADTSPHISTQSAKSAAADCLISIYSCDVSSPPPLCS